MCMVQNSLLVNLLPCSSSSWAACPGPWSRCSRSSRASSGPSPMAGRLVVSWQSTEGCSANLSRAWQQQQLVPAGHAGTYRLLQPRLQRTALKTIYSTNRGCKAGGF